MPEDDGPGYSDLSAPKRQPRNGKSAHIVEGSPESGCNVRTQDPENFDEEVKSLVTAWSESWHDGRSTVGYECFPVGGSPIACLIHFRIPFPEVITHYPEM